MPLFEVRPDDVLVIDSIPLIFDAPDVVYVFRNCIYAQKETITKIKIELEKEWTPTLNTK